MTYLKYYREERKKFAGSPLLSDPQIRYVFKRLKTKYKIPQCLILRKGGDSGNCGSFSIRVSHNCSTLVLAHEIAHAIRRKKMKWKVSDGVKPHAHDKKHAKVTEKVHKFIVKKLPEWEYMIVVNEVRRLAKKRVIERKNSKIKRKVN